MAPNSPVNLLSLVMEDNLNDLKDQLSQRKWCRDDLNIAIRCAAKEAKPSIFKALHKAGANPMSKDSKDRNCLHLLLRYGKGNLDILRIILAHVNKGPAFIDAKDKKGWPPLCYAAQKGYADCVHLLINHGANVNKYTSYDRETPLIMAANKGDEKSVKLLLDRGADVNKRGLVYNTALNKAVQTKNTSVIKILIDAGADVNASDMYGHSPLTWAAEWGCYEAAKILLSHNAHVNKSDNQGRTPLFSAAAGGDINLVELLIEHGANVNATSESGLSPFLMAIKRGHVDVAKVLVKHNANIYQTVNTNTNALHLACFSNCREGVKYLLEEFGNIYDINGWDEKGKTPLIISCEAVGVNVVSTLLDYNADANVRDRSNRTPMNTVLRTLNIFPLQTMQIIGILLRHGADINLAGHFEAHGTFSLYYSQNHTSTSKELPIEIAAKLSSVILVTIFWKAGSLPGRIQSYLTEVKFPFYTPKQLGISLISNPIFSSHEHICKILSNFIRHPRSLASLCRIIIRHILKSPLQKKIESLGLPDPIRNYLNIPEIDNMEEVIAAEETLTEDDHDDDYHAEDADSDETMSDSSGDCSMASDSEMEESDLEGDIYL